MRAIGAGAARLWLLPPAASAAELDACLAVLSAGERDRAARFAFAADRRLYLTAHAAVRHALSAVRPEVAPRDWAFGRERGGRPYAVGAGRWDFNLSHTRGRVACLVAPGLRCGVDVEAVSARVAALGSAVFAPAELARLQGPGSATEATVLWTLKEAYAKARGLGLRLPFARCEFAVRGVSARLVAGPDGHVGRYRFHCLREGGYAVAVAMDAASGGAAPVVRSGSPDWGRPDAWFAGGTGSPARGGRSRPGSPARSQSSPYA